MVSSKPINTGFTLIELLIVIAITGVLVALALPGMERMVASQRINNRADQMLSLFQFARAEAIRTNKPVLICPTIIRKNSATSNVCEKFSEYKAGKGWQGFLAFADNDMSGSYLAANDSPVRVVALNQNTNDVNKIKVLLRWQSFDVNRRKIQDNIINDQVLGFMPNGQFGIGEGANVDNWIIGQLNVVMEVRDNHYANISRRIVITPSGKPVACKRGAGNTNNFCTISLS